MTDLIIGNETFRVEIAGDPTRPALMLSNSLGTDLGMWDGQVASLSKHFRVIRYDPRGHGGSVTEDAPVSLATLGGDALAILDALEIDKVHWLGLSMGGAVGLWLLANAPDRIDRAVLANTAPRFGTPDGWNARITDVLANGMAANAEATMERWFSPGFVDKAPERTGAIHAMLREASPQGYAAACAALRDMDLREALFGIDHEVLIITGTDDPVVPDADAEAFIAGIAGARHVALAARHLSNIEAEAAFNAAVVTFLTAKPTSRVRRDAKKTAPRKTAPVKAAAPAKRGGAGRRSNAARSPLKKVAPKKAAAKKTRRAPAKTVTTTTGRRASAKTSAARRAPPKALSKAAPKKASAKKAAAKITRKAAPARRPTPVTAARGPVKKAARPKKAATKASVKKAAAKSVAKKLPGARRRPTKKSGRPTGRRKK